MELAMVGLGRMGLNMAIRLIRVERQPRNSKKEEGVCHEI
jgi:6-phosphogluconate dehydrogenase (decarboxylating)